MQHHLIDKLDFETHKLRLCPLIEIRWPLIISQDKSRFGSLGEIEFLFYFLLKTDKQLFFFFCV